VTVSTESIFALLTLACGALTLLIVCVGAFFRPKALRVTALALSMVMVIWVWVWLRWPETHLTQYFGTDTVDGFIRMAIGCGIVSVLGLVVAALPSWATIRGSKNQRST
jgi:hypothetical protein